MSDRGKVLVVGGAGYIGSVVCRALRAAGHPVAVFDDLSRGHRAAVPEGIPLHVGDLADAEAVRRVFEGERPAAVMHFAARIEAGESMVVPERYFRHNTGNTMTLLEVMVEQGVRTLVFSSTAALFGNPERVPIEETDRLEPTNPYGESKLLVERMLAWHARLRGLQYASLRYFNAAGATPDAGEDHDPETHLIPIVLQVAQGRRPHVSVFGTDYPTPDGTCVRDYIHVSDLASAHVLALEAMLGGRADGPLVYNLGNGRGYSVREVIEVARRVTGHAIPTVETPRRAGDPAILVASSEKIRRELGWAPTRDLAAIVSDAWEWHRTHPAGYAEPALSQG